MSLFNIFKKEEQEKPHQFDVALKLPKGYNVKVETNKTGETIIYFEGIASDDEYWLLPDALSCSKIGAEKRYISK